VHFSSRKKARLKARERRGKGVQRGADRINELKGGWSDKPIEEKNLLWAMRHKKIMALGRAE